MSGAITRWPPAAHSSGAPETRASRPGRSWLRRRAPRTPTVTAPLAAWCRPSACRPAPGPTRVSPRPCQGQSA
eukprot:scaffold15394_cov111-Isochrysis_galbana.AAC.8